MQISQYAICLLYKVDQSIEMLLSVNGKKDERSICFIFLSYPNSKEQKGDFSFPKM